MKRTRIDLRWMAPVVTCVLAALAGCSDSMPSATAPTVPPPTTTTTTQPAATLLVQGTTAIPARQVFFVDVTTPRAGRVDVTVSYGSAANQVLLWLTDRQCSFTLFDRDDCDYLVKSLEGSTPRTMSAASVAPGTYTLFISNDGPNDDQVTYQVTLTP